MSFFFAVFAWSYEETFLPTFLPSLTLVQAEVANAWLARRLVCSRSKSMVQLLARWSTAFHPDQYRYRVVAVDCEWLSSKRSATATVLAHLLFISLVCSRRPQISCPHYMAGLRGWVGVYAGTAVLWRPPRAPGCVLLHFSFMRVVSSFPIPSLSKNYPPLPHQPDVRLQRDAAAGDSNMPLLSKWP